MNIIQNTAPGPPTVTAIATPAILPRPIKRLGTPEVIPTEEAVAEPMSNEIAEVMEEQEAPQEVASESVVEVAEEREYSTLRPITKTLTPQQQPKANVAKLTPVRHMLEPVKKTRFSPFGVYDVINSASWNDLGWPNWKLGLKSSVSTCSFIASFILVTLCPKPQVQSPDKPSKIFRPLLSL